MTQTVLITGASGGIGRGIALAYARQGDVKLALAGSKPGEALDTLVAEVRALGAQATGLVADITDPDGCKRLVEEAQAFCGDLSAVVSNAGASGPDTLADMSVDRWDRCVALNTRPTFLLAQAARAGLARTRGSVVAIASMSGMHPHPGYGAYSAAKAALIMLVRQIAQEWGAQGIRANAVCPGMTRTPLTEAVYQIPGVQAQREALVPLSRIGTPEDVARAAWYLGVDATKTSGELLAVDAGARLMPL